MTISKGSQSHVALNASMAERLAKNPDMDLVTIRDIFESPHVLASEAAGVLYEDVQVDGLSALWAKPQGVAAATRVLLFFHGGGFMTGSPNSHRKLCGHLATAASAWILSLGYRRSPEFQFPAQVEDSVEAYKWLLKQGYKPSAISTCGDSAGGNLAVTCVLKLRQEGIALPAAIVCLSPWCDMEISGATVDSNQQFDALVKKETLKLMKDPFLGQQSPRHPLANPLHADMKGLPPMYVTWSTTEVLADDSVRLVAQAKKGGVEVTEEPVPDLQHVHVFCAGKAIEADKTIANIGQWLKKKLD